MERLVAHRSARWALVVLGILIVAALVGPMFTGTAATTQLDIVGLKNQPPSWQHWFGTDQYSRDVLARVLDGARLSLAIATIAVIMSMTIGTGYGLVAGFVGGRTDAIMMRLLDGFLSIPRILLLIAVLSVWQPDVPGLIVIIGCTSWFGVSRLVRAEALGVRQLEYIESARALGAPTVRILWRHVLPNVIAPVVVTATLAVGNIIVLEAGLAFLGVGVHPPTASWGVMFLEGASAFAGAWWVVVFPGIAIVATVMAFNVLGDALRDVLDPRQLHQSQPVPDPVEAWRSRPVVRDVQLVENG